MEYALGYKHCTSGSDQKFRPMLRAPLPAVLAGPLRLPLWTKGFCWRIPRIQSCHACNCCTLAWLHRTSSCVFCKYRNLSWFCWQIAVSGQPFSDRGVGRSYSDLRCFLRTHENHPRGVVAWGGLAPKGERRGDGDPDIRSGRQSNAAQTAADL